MTPIDASWEIAGQWPRDNDNSPTWRYWGPWSLLRLCPPLVCPIRLCFSTFNPSNLNYLSFLFITYFYHMGYSLFFFISISYNDAPILKSLSLSMEACDELTCGIFKPRALGWVLRTGDISPRLRPWKSLPCSRKTQGELEASQLIRVCVLKDA